MRAILTMVCLMSVMGVVGAVEEPSAKKTSLTEEELRTLAKSVPDVKNAGMLYSVAMATNNVEWKQAYLKASAACLFVCDKRDIYTKLIKDKLEDAAEFENELKEECKQCSGSGTKGRRCDACSGKGQCSNCRGSGQTVTMAFDRPNGWKTCIQCKGNKKCKKCGGKGSINGKCWTCAGTGKVFSKTIAERLFCDSCNAIAEGRILVAKPTNKPKVNPEQLDILRKAEEEFAKRCVVFDGEAHVMYNDVQYGIARNTDGNYNFTVSYHEVDRTASFVIFTMPESYYWYSQVVECSEKIKSWVRISAKNKVKRVSKEIPLLLDGPEGFVNAVTWGVGQNELVYKDFRKPYSLLALESKPQLVKFIGVVNADSSFKKFEVSIRMRCGDYFDCDIFRSWGNIYDIDKEIDKINKELVKFLVFVNPESLEKARDMQAKTDTLFD